MTQYTLCVGAVVMFFDNELFKMGLMNCSIGIVHDICYKMPDDVRKKDVELYAVVGIPESTLDTTLKAGKPPT